MGVKASIGGPEISHVMYANDTVLFSWATRIDAEKINDCIEKYYNWSRQKLNINKYGVFLSKYTHSQPQRLIKQILQMKGLKQDDIYLGTPLFLSRAPSKDFKFIQDWLQAWFTGWRSKCLSWVGKCTLINLVA